MATPIPSDMFASDVIADPYGYYGRLRDEDPVHWNEAYELWAVTRYEDVVWLTRHHDGKCSVRKHNVTEYPCLLRLDDVSQRRVRGLGLVSVNLQLLLNLLRQLAQVLVFALETESLFANHRLSDGKHQDYRYSYCEP